MNRQVFDPVVKRLSRQGLESVSGYNRASQFKQAPANKINLRRWILGAWAEGAFGNDIACDWAGNLQKLQVSN